MVLNESYKKSSEAKRSEKLNRKNIYIFKEFWPEGREAGASGWRWAKGRKMETSVIESTIKIK